VGGGRGGGGGGGGIHAPWGIFWIKIRGSTIPYPWTNTPLSLSGRSQAARQDVGRDPGGAHPSTIDRGEVWGVGRHAC